MYLMIGVLLALTACAPIVEVTKIGNEYVQHAYSRNFWWPNWDRAVFCPDKDKNGFCPKEDMRVETITVTAQKAAGQVAAEQAVGSIPMAAAFGVGLAHSGSRITQSVGGFNVNEHFSTKLFQK